MLMRSNRGRWWGAGAFVALGAGGMGPAGGCSSPLEDCYFRQCLPQQLDRGGLSQGLPPECAGDPTEDAATLSEECGVFVSASATADGNGTRARPFRSFAEAAEKKPLGKRVYACAEEYAEGSGVSFDGGVQIFAGFTECDGAWRWSAEKRATLKGPADAIALAVHGGEEGESLIANLDVLAADAVAEGGSSIAVLVEGGIVAIVNSDMTAGAARDGVAMNQTDDVPVGESDRSDGVGVCESGALNKGPVDLARDCPDGTRSTGGQGGDGGIVTFSPDEVHAAGNGANGTRTDATGRTMDEATPAGQPPPGRGGEGEEEHRCTNGEDGANGGSGMAGDGASGPGQITPNGYLGSKGADGARGAPGQGGGGGGGAKGGLNVSCGKTASPRVGASGGAGGSGGCGGLGGAGGQAGGSSIALIALDAELYLDRVLLSAGEAGHGGQGGTGVQGGMGGPGGLSGPGAPGANGGCIGGQGGQGGQGGPGGGGQGGHSLGIALQRSRFHADGPSVGDAPVIDPQNRGLGGPGGGAAPILGGPGADGEAARCWDFTNNKECNLP
jgi:hypothetical protein